MSSTNEHTVSVHNHSIHNPIWQRTAPTEERQAVYALAMTTGGNGSTFAFFLLGVPLPFFVSPPRLAADMSGVGGTGPGVAGGALPSGMPEAGGAAPAPAPEPELEAAGGFALLFFLLELAAGVALLTVPSGPIFVCKGLGASSGMTVTEGTSCAGPGGRSPGAAVAGLMGMEGRVDADGIGAATPGGAAPGGGAGRPGPAGKGGTPTGCAGATREAVISATRLW